MPYEVKVFEDSQIHHPVIIRTIVRQLTAGVFYLLFVVWSLLLISELQVYGLLPA
jgi:hypothetical protein